MLRVTQQVSCRAGNRTQSPETRNHTLAIRPHDLPTESIIAHLNEHSDREWGEQTLQDVALGKQNTPGERCSAGKGLRLVPFKQMTKRPLISMGKGLGLP